MMPVEHDDAAVVGRPHFDSEDVKGWEANKLTGDAHHSNPKRLVLAIILSAVAIMAELWLDADALLSKKSFGFHTFGMVCAVIFWCLGSAVGGHRRAHVTLQLCAMVALIIGYAGIYISHTSGNRRLHGDHDAHAQKQHHHQLALTHPKELFEKPVARALHVIIGYAVLAWVTVQVLSGFVKIYSISPKLKWHGRHGRQLCVLGTLNVGIGLGIRSANSYAAFLGVMFITIAVLTHSMRWVKAARCVEESQELRHDI
eukprot:TRINITY_DN67797_c0_g1_i1.p1 TRINITY_DN67797_c0_g1~~TRINITY_DN67797_c0_g1_i1.p1  ORF type:complete len:257 (+),score=23.98 TRINITY_DN67797_c0_g1_i1:56-826(+)